MSSTHVGPSSDVPPRRSGARTILVLILLIVGVFVGFVIGQQNSSSTTPQKSESTSGLDFNLLDTVYGIIRNEYVNQPANLKQLEYGMIRGLVAGLGDPNSNFMDPEETRAFQENLSGEFEGIGIEIAIKEEQLTVVAPIPNSPAERAGLESGDSIVQIEETLASTLTLDEAVQLIRGPRGTEVTLLVARDGEFEAQAFSIVRETIEIESVAYELREDGIAHIHIARFGEDTARVLEGIAREILESDARGVVLDLRGNPGGFLETSVEVASLFIEEGTIVTEEYGDGRKQEYSASGNALLKDVPLVVLVDEGSASASEIVAGALQDYGRAQLVGTKTFGKGSVQELKPLEDNTSLRLTVALFVLPEGRKIDHEGILPDVEIEFSEDTPAESDVQLERALEVLQESR